MSEMAGFATSRLEKAIAEAMMSRVINQGEAFRILFADFAISDGAANSVPPPSFTSVCRFNLDAIHMTRRPIAYWIMLM